jgi:hypothetical protein
MTLETGIFLLVAGALLVFTAMWAIHHAAEKRLRHMISTALARPIWAYEASTARSRALDDEYRQLVATEQGKIE